MSLMMAGPAIAAPASVSPIMVMTPEPVWPKGVPSMAAWPGTAPTPVVEATRDNGDRVYNVTVPTWQAFRPAPGTANGAAVIVAPGGGFRELSIHKEGTEVAQWLAAHGIAAFVLKYRLVQQVGDEAAFRKKVQSMPPEVIGQPGVEDGMELLHIVRAHATAWGIDPHRVGVVGFSAGGHVASMMALEPDKARRADFAGLIYGVPFARKLPDLPAANLLPPPGTPKEPWLAPPPVPSPDALPPLFMAMAQDDVAVGQGFRAFYDALFAAGYRPDLHLYHKGRHGFGMRPVGSTADHWIDEFGWWMDSVGLTAKP